MKTPLATLLIAAVFGLVGIAATGCETSHEESTKQNLFGGTTHESTTTVQNPITGDTSVSHEKEVTH